VTNVNENREASHGKIAAVDQAVLGQAVGDELDLHKPHEVSVENEVDNEEYALLSPVPYVVHRDPRLADLQTGRNPNNEDANVDEANDQGDRELYSPRFIGIVKDQGDSVCQNLGQALDLDRVRVVDL